MPCPLYPKAKRQVLARRLGGPAGLDVVPKRKIKTSPTFSSDLKYGRES
jgi:hypothetical protein